MPNCISPMIHLLYPKMAPKNTYFLMKLWNAYCILQTALLKVATSPVRRQTHPKPLQCKVTIVMMDTSKKFRDQMEQQIILLNLGQGKLYRGGDI